MELLIGQNKASEAGGDPVSDGDQKTFVKDVMEASRTVPVLVDFWATWCAPCKQLTPILEKVVRAAAGRIKLVKIDIEKNRSLVQQLGGMGLPMQSVPVVAAFWKGQVIDLVQGALPESEIKKFVGDILKLAGSSLPGADLLTQAKTAQQDGHTESALGLFSELVAAEPDNAEAWAGLVRCLITLGLTDDAESVLAQIPDGIVNHAAIESARTALAVAAEGQKAMAQIAGLQARVEADAADHEARFELASAFNASGQRVEAADALLHIIRTDRTWRDDAARLQLLKFFEAWGLDDPASLGARRKLSTLLFR